MRGHLSVLLVATLLTAVCGSTEDAAPDLIATVSAESTPTTASPAPTMAEPTSATTAATPTPTPVPRLLSVSVNERRGHDAAAFTQGLEYSGGRLFESRGQEGASGISEIDPSTGAVLRWQPLDGEAFGEGFTVVDDHIVMLTWQAQTALVFNIDTFELVETLSYEGEGWGLCYDQSRLVMSNGSAELTFRDPATFDVISRVEVTYDGEPVPQLNELECVNDRVYANVWKQDVLVVIDPATGIIEKVIDARGLLTPEEAESADVLNGIAYDDRTNTFLLTGKYWPAMFDVTLTE